MLSKEMGLCKYCLKREGLKARPKPECDLCGGLLQRTSLIAKDIASKLIEYDFQTFLIGATIPQSSIDQEDELRARFKIKGRESLKSEITRLLTRKISTWTGKHPDYAKPDVTILVALSDGTISITPRSIWLQARYTKSVRGLPQRSSDCKMCNGLGCVECGYKGKSGRSVQSIATTYFCNRFQAESANFIWLGSEDEMSLVGGSGRPFYIEVVKPKKRLEGNRRIFFKSDEIRILDVKRLLKRITDVPQVDIRCRVHLKSPGGPLSSEKTQEIETNFLNCLVNVRLSRKYRVVKRLVRSIKVNAQSDGRVDLLIDCEGGIPIKKLVTGQDDTVEPNLTYLIAPFTIDDEKPFDILDVNMRTTPKAEVKGSSEAPFEANESQVQYDA
jgi:tRNA pseudouridine synthase 10